MYSNHTLGVYALWLPCCNSTHWGSISFPGVTLRKTWSLGEGRWSPGRDTLTVLGVWNILRGSCLLRGGGTKVWSGELAWEAAKENFYACIRYGNSIECMCSRPKVSFTDHSYSGLPPGSRSRTGGAKAPLAPLVSPPLCLLIPPLPTALIPIPSAFLTSSGSLNKRKS